MALRVADSPSWQAAVASAVAEAWRALICWMEGAGGTDGTDISEGMTSGVMVTVGMVGISVFRGGGVW